jgi:hypothetical protein
MMPTIQWGACAAVDEVMHAGGNTAGPHCVLVITVCFAALLPIDG